MFDMGAETMALPMEEKMKFEQGDGGMSFGCVHERVYAMSFIDCASDTKQREPMQQTPQARLTQSNS